MKRRYHVERFLEKTDMIRAKLDNPAFTTDVIVGFPGETDQEFEETIETCKRAKFMKIHIFPFSARKSTPAADFENQVDPQIRKERCKRLAEVERDLAFEYYQTLEDKNLEVLIERIESDGLIGGSDRRYIPIVVPGTEADIGKLIQVTGVKANEEHLLATRINHADSIVEPKSIPVLIHPS